METPIPEFIALNTIDYIVLRPDNTEPGMTYFLSDGRRLDMVFINDQECDKAWAEVEETLRNKDFIRNYGVFFRAERLLALEKRHTEELGYCLYFKFAKSSGFRQRYIDEQTRDAGYARLIGLLTVFQDMRAGYEASPTKH
ncbi:MAG: hypothetical protein Q7S52_03270 [bacterium]|nr:hypothetical protein [bacterium]